MGLLDRRKKDKKEDKKKLGELYERGLKLELDDEELEKVSGGICSKQLY